MIFPTSIATIQSTLRSTGPSGGGGAPSSGFTRLLFSGATSVLGGTNYQMGQLIHSVTIDGSGNSSISVSKTASSTDVDISSFQTTGTVSTNLADNFVIRAIGTRNSANSAIQGANTLDSVGVVGMGNPNKIDIYNGNASEGIKFEIVNLNASSTFILKAIHVTRANYVEGEKPVLRVNLFNPAAPELRATITETGSSIFTLDNFNSNDSSLTGTGAGINGIFDIGIGQDEPLFSNVGYGLYAIDFDVITTPVQPFSNAAGDIYVNAAGDSYTQP